MPIFYPFSSFSSPSCPLCSPKPEAFGPLQQLCPAFGWVRDWAAQGSSCHSFPWRRSGRARRWHGWRNLKHVAGLCPTALWRTRSCLLYLTGFSCGKCWGRRGRGTANVNTCEYVFNARVLPTTIPRNFPSCSFRKVCTFYFTGRKTEASWSRSQMGRLSTFPRP